MVGFSGKSRCYRACLFGCAVFFCAVLRQQPPGPAVNAGRIRAGGEMSPKRHKKNWSNAGFFCTFVSLPQLSGAQKSDYGKSVF